MHFLFLLDFNVLNIKIIVYDFFLLVLCELIKFYSHNSFYFIYQNDYARYTENTSPAETRGGRQQHKSTYSPPPRMLRQRNLKHSGDTEKKKNATQSDVSLFHCVYCRNIYTASRK